jgi:peptidoglycan glycosyltransferase
VADTGPDTILLDLFRTNQFRELLIAAALEGVELAGKTGTAEIDIAQGINDLWFIGFAGNDAVAVVIDHEKGQGGTVAAPIAKRVLQALGS